MYNVILVALIQNKEYCVCVFVFILKKIIIIL